MTPRRVTRKKSIIRNIKYSKGDLDEINEIIFQDDEMILQDKKLNMPSYVKNLYQAVQILVMVVFAMIRLCRKLGTDS